MWKYEKVYNMWSHYSFLACIEECFADTETFEGSSAQFYERQDEEKMRTSNVWKYLAGSDSDDEQSKTNTNK